MTLVWLAIGALALALAVVTVALARTRRRVAELSVTAQRPAGGLEPFETPRASAPQEPRLAGARSSTTEASPVVITEVGRDLEDVVPPAAPVATQRIEGRMFADVVLRETVIKGASLVHGVRSALAPETRNRIRFAMRQESKRARKQRKVEAREALREYRARRHDGYSSVADTDGNAA